MADHPSLPRLWGIVLAGGAGRRLQPTVERLTGAPTPKQYCSFGHPRTLLQSTVDRLTPIVPAHRTVAVVAHEETERAGAQLRGFVGLTTLAQPLDRGTATGILFPLTEIHRRDPNAIVVITPADHRIAEPAVFVSGLRQAAAAVRRRPQSLVVGGAAADAPSTDLGWIVARRGPIARGEPDIRRVERFAEKPNGTEAHALWRAGAMWSTFVIVARVDALLERFRRHLPVHAAWFAQYGAMADRGEREAWLSEHYAELPAADFSRDMLVGAQDVAVLAWPRTLGWSDLGNERRLLDWLAAPAMLDQSTSRSA